MPASNNAPVAPALLEDFPEIEQVARVFGGTTLLRRDEAAFYEERLRFADPAIFEIFDFDWLEGDPKTALSRPATIVLTQTLATKYFGTADPIGQTLGLDLIPGKPHPLEVTGVIGNLPDNTTLSIDALVSLDTLTAMFGRRLLERRNSSTDFHTYFLLRKGASVAPIRAAMPDFVKRRLAEPGMLPSSMTIMALRDIHTRSTRDEEWKPAGSVAAISVSAPSRC